MTLPDVTALWFGESAWPSSPVAVEAACAALKAGDHFYQPNSGRLTLREALSDYQSTLYGHACAADRITVTASAMQALALAAQALVNPGDKVTIIEPAWPNMAECFRLVGADVHAIALQARHGRWQLDMDALLDRIDSRTRAVIVNSPSNPTGWVMTSAEQIQLLDHCRNTGSWIIADDVYARLYRHAAVAPGFLSIATPEDRLLVINSFSKAWSMTGWRLGWITAPATLEATLAALTEYNIAGPPGFIQRAGEVMIKHGEPAIDELKARLEVAYDIVEKTLGASSRVGLMRADGAFYSFMSIEGATDSLAMAKALLHSARTGVAPGIAFGASGEGYLRLCYAQPESVLRPALERMVHALEA